MKKHCRPACASPPLLILQRGDPPATFRLGPGGLPGRWEGAAAPEPGRLPPSPARSPARLPPAFSARAARQECPALPHLPPALRARLPVEGNGVDPALCQFCRALLPGRGVPCRGQALTQPRSFAALGSRLQPSGVPLPGATASREQRLSPSVFS